MASLASPSVVEAIEERQVRWLGYVLQGFLLAVAAEKPKNVARARAVLALGMAEILKTGELLGRVGVIAEAASVQPPPVDVGVTPLPATPTPPPTPPPGPPGRPPAPPKVPGVKPPEGNIPYFKEAYEDVLARVPTVIKDPVARTYTEIGRLYEEGHVFAIVRTAEETVTERVRDLVAKGIREGLSVEEVRERLVSDPRYVVGETADWTKAYADTVYRTNLATAHSAGRHDQAQDPSIRRVAPLFEFFATQDDATRPNHLAAHGTVAATDDPIWGYLSPPLGYNCRCRLQLVPVSIARAKGYIDEEGRIVGRAPRDGAGPDPGFVHAAGRRR